MSGARPPREPWARGQEMVLLGAVATLLVAAAALAGYRLDEASPQIRLHLGLALCGSLLLLLSHGWVSFYLLGLGPLVGEAAAAQESGAAMIYRARVARRRVWLTAPLASALAVAWFSLGFLGYTGDLPPAAHHPLFFATAGLQVWALRCEAEGLRIHDGILRQRERRDVAQNGDQE